MSPPWRMLELPFGGFQAWGGSWVFLSSRSGHSCARLSRGSDVMHNGSPSGCRNGGMRGKSEGTETRSLRRAPVAAARAAG